MPRRAQVSGGLAPGPGRAAIFGDKVIGGNVIKTQLRSGKRTHMTQQRQTFDWTAWYAKIPGIPLDWGFVSKGTAASPRSEIRPPRRRRLHLAN